MQVWQIGVNTIVFDEPFGDTNYTFHADAPSDVIIHEVIGSRTPGGLQITLNQGTIEGWYDAEGLSNEIRAMALIESGAGLIQTGKQAVIQGRNTITFPMPFGDTTYSFDAVGNAVNVTIDMNSKTTTSIDVIMADDDPDFQFTAIGVS